jgi:hypothetical protein
MARKKQSGQQRVSRFGAAKPGQAHKHRGAKGHAETPSPRTSLEPLEPNERDDELLAAAYEDDPSPADVELDALEKGTQHGGVAGHDDSLNGSDDEVVRAADLEVTEPQGDVDLLSDTIRNASLFDQPSEEGDPHAPRIAADEMARDEPEGMSAQAREFEKQRERDKLRKTREHDEPARPKRSNHAR